MTNYRIDRIGTDFDHIDTAKQYSFSVWILGER